MSLTRGTGPLSRRPEAGQLNGRIEGPRNLLWFHEVPKRVRAVLAGQTVVDTEGAWMLHETGRLPVYYLPREDVRWDLLEESPTRTHCPYKGEARYWSVRVGDRLAEDAVWGYDDPVDGAPDLAPYVALYSDRMDAWFEEDVQVLGHPRDPFHRVDVRASTRRVSVRAGDEVLAETDSPVLVFETGLPTRYYLPREDWRVPLEHSATTSVCPYKGVSSYLSARVGDRLVEDIAWTYEEPLEEALGVRGMVCVAQEDDRVDVEVGPGR